MKKLVLFFVCLFIISGYAQLTEIKNFPEQVVSANNKTSQLLYKDNVYYLFYYEYYSDDQDSSRIMVSKSTDAVNWGSGTAVTSFIPLFNGPSYLGDALSFGCCIYQDKLLVLFKQKNLENYLVYSNDGNLWSDTIKVYVSSPTRRYFRNYSFESSNDSLYLLCNSRYSGLPQYINCLSTADLHNWSYKQIPLPHKRFSSIQTSEKRAIFYENNYSDGGIYLRYYQNGVVSDSISVLPAGYKAYDPKALRTADGSVWLAFNIKTNIFKMSDIAYIVSTDNMQSWSQPQQFTSYVGFDSLRSISAIGNLPLVSFFSTRNVLYSSNKRCGISYGILSQSLDNAHGTPAIYSITEELNGASLYLIFKTAIDSTLSTDKIYISYTIDNGTSDTLLLYDDGLHGDSVANDHIYGNNLHVQTRHQITYTVEIKRGNLRGKSELHSYWIPLVYADDYFNIDINKIKLPINNKGVLADIYLPNVGSLGGRYDEGKFLFSGGFFASGYKGNYLWGNGEATASLVENYVPGPVSSDPLDPDNLVYNVNNSDSAFSESWQEWKYAVQLGADFYDGDNDGAYNPVDLNSNGKWDSNEDKPFIIGDLTTWCVYNDGVPAEQRLRFVNQHPQGLEIQQTIFGAHTNDGKTNNILFIRYKLINKSLTNQDFTSVIFSPWTDPDLGVYYDDLVGCDTLLNSAFIYNSGADGEYGSNPPAFFIQLLQGPKNYLPGITFNDINGNGIFDEGVDLPLDTAYVKMGPDLGIKEFPGARNENINSFVHYMQSDPVLGDPNDERELRYYQFGKNKIGEVPNPCTWNLGEVRGGVNCAQVNPAFWYSGDPVQNIGWINTRKTEQKMMLNIGPFDLKYGEERELLLAYVVGRGSNAINSITVARDIAEYAKLVYDNNFVNLPLAIRDKGSKNIPSSFRLSQNYPNPFNPSTKIKFSVGGVPGSYHNVMLKVYDILGREAAVLVSDNRMAGEYEISFNSNQFSLSSGVYFYRLTVDDYMLVRKMILLK